MTKKIFTTGLALLLVTVLFTGCSSTAKPASTTGKIEIMRQAVLGGKWQMYQIRITLDSGGDYDLDLLNLANNDIVDGYFYPERGTGVSLQITAGANVIYKTETAVAGGTLSDRFSFTATQPVGTAYVLKFHNGGTEKNVTVFVELIYPNTASLRGPIDTK